MSSLLTDADLRRPLAVSALMLGLGVFAACGSGGDEAPPNPNPTPQDGADGGDDASPAPVTPPKNPEHVVTMKNASGAALTSYPLQLGRPFLPGEIKDTPVMFVDGVQVASQAEVTLRWADGSARYAALSAVLSDLPAGASAKLTFGSTTPAASTKSVAELLAEFPDFDAQLALVQGGATKTASARAMMQAGDAHWVAQGPLRYELVVADHVGRKYDVGFGAHRPLRPLFYVAFWPTLKKTRVRVVVESPNLDALEDVQYSASVKSGVASPEAVYEKANLAHVFGQRWTKTFWVGGAPEEDVDFDYNLTYLTATALVPNYDPASPPKPEKLDGTAESWTKAGHDVGDSGLWTAYMPTTGMRDDIGPIPEWTELWLSSGDHRMREIALTQADLAGGWPLQFREHDASLRFDRAGTVPASGRPMSLNAHPGIWFPNNNGVYPGALPTPRLPGSWVPDGAHQPEPFSVPYLLTGDSYYLESLQLWAATQAFAYPPGGYGRGKDGFGGITDQIRGNGWVIRSRGLAASLSPDGSPEKRYFYELMEDAVAYWEGQRGIADPALAAHPNYVWAAQNSKQEWSPLGFWGRDTNTRFESLWMDYFFLMELGFVRDLGLPVDTMLGQYSRLITGQFGVPGYDPRLMAAYQTPTIKNEPNFPWYTTWPEVAAALSPEYAAAAIGAFEGTSDNFYAVAASAAGAALTPYPGGADAWTWLKGKTYVQDLESHRRYKVLPRTTTLPVPPKF